MQRLGAPPRCPVQQLQRLTRRCWQLLLGHPTLAPRVESKLLEACPGIRADKRLFRSFTRWKTAVARRNGKTLRWAVAGLSKRLVRAAPDGELLSSVVSLAQVFANRSRDPADLLWLFDVHQTYADYRSERSRLVATYAHLVEELVAASAVREQDREDVLHDGILLLAAAPAVYRPDASSSFEGFARPWLARQLGLEQKRSAA